MPRQLYVNQTDMYLTTKERVSENVCLAVSGTVQAPLSATELRERHEASLKISSSRSSRESRPLPLSRPRSQHSFVPLRDWQFRCTIKGGCLLRGLAIAG